MHVDVLFFDGCPSYEALMPRLRALVADLGLRPDVISLVRVESYDDAEAQRFLGSPTVRINDLDVEPGAGARDDFGLKCRIYRVAGEQRHTPPDDWIRSALTSAASARRNA